MEYNYAQALDDYVSSMNMQIEKGPNSISFVTNTPEGRCVTSIFDALPFLHLIYFDIGVRSMPGDAAGSSFSAGQPPIQLNYCISGKTELMLDDQSYIYMNPGDLCLSRQASQGETYFPLGYYQGIALYFEDAFFEAENQAFLREFLPDANLLKTIYLTQRGTFLGEAGPEIREVMDRLWKLYSNPEIFHKKLYLMELLHCLLNPALPCPEKSCVFFTNTQVEIAKKAEQLLTADLSTHIPIRTIAEQFGVSETSLKNYFRGVYGQNISTYLRDLRMRTGEELLLNTGLSIAEIAFQVGYTKQGKFAEIFKEQFGQTPLEYRRRKQLQKY